MPVVQPTPNSTPSPQSSFAANILVVDDNAGLRHYLTQFLSAEHFEVRTACSGAEMDQVLKTGKVDLIVLDWMMPVEDGLSICKRLSEQNGPAIIMLTAKNEDNETIRALDLGADDYIVKPFNPNVLVARIRAVLRRKKLITALHAANVINAAGWSLDIIRRQLTSPSKAITKLTNTEVFLLRYFLEHRGEILKREQILLYLGESRENVADRALETIVSRLRRKIAAADPGGHGAHDLIRTVYGVGYMLKADDQID